MRPVARHSALAAQGRRQRSRNPRVGTSDPVRTGQCAQSLSNFPAVVSLAAGAFSPVSAGGASYGSTPLPSAATASAHRLTCTPRMAGGPDGKVRGRAALDQLLCAFCKECLRALCAKRQLHRSQRQAGKSQAPGTARKRPAGVPPRYPRWPAASIRKGDHP